MSLPPISPLALLILLSHHLGYDLPATRIALGQQHSPLSTLLTSEKVPLMAPLPSRQSDHLLTIHNFTSSTLHFHLPSHAATSTSASTSNLLPSIQTVLPRQSTSLLDETRTRRRRIEISSAIDDDVCGVAEEGEGEGVEEKIPLSRRTQRRARFTSHRWGKSSKMLRMEDCEGGEVGWWVFEQKTGKRSRELHVYEKRNLSRWLGDLPDEIELSKLYLPGTHESLAIHGFPISSCQSFPILRQLEAGHRFLDLRFALKNNVLVGYHGIQNQFITAEEVVGVLYDFLKKNPTECIVLSVKQENGAGFFEDRMWELLDLHKWMWYDKDRWPTLGEVRGKCVMFCRFGFKSLRGLHAAYWPNNSAEAWEVPIGGKRSIIQDWYSIGSFLSIPEKAALSLSLFRPLKPHPSLLPSSQLVPSPTPVRINFLSGATLLTAFPFVVAKGLGWITLFGVGVKGVNQRVLDALLKMQGEERMERGLEGDGMVVLMDYYEVPGGLTELLVAWNFYGK